jgi:pimeloyl-ACP methyl ester carboxylesterase
VRSREPSEPARGATASPHRPREWLVGWQRRRVIQVIGSCAGLLFASCLACQPLQHWGASAIVVAPNRGVAAPARALGELTVAVGPPAATLSLEIIDASSRPLGTVFLLHGIRSDKTSMRGWGRMLADAGFRAVLVDLRGHGRSTGDWLSYGVVESRDLAQALDALEARGLRIGSVGVMGISYGAATAIEWAGSDPRISAVVAVAPFASLREVVPGYSPLPLPATFVNGAIDMAGRQGGFDPDKASPVDAISRTRAHVLLVHGEADGRIPPWHSQQIFDRGRDHAELLLVPGAGHGSIGDEPILLARAPGWFVRYLRPDVVTEPEKEPEKESPPIEALHQ